MQENRRKNSANLLDLPPVFGYFREELPELVDGQAQIGEAPHDESVHLAFANRFKESFEGAPARPGVNEQLDFGSGQRLQKKVCRRPEISLLSQRAEEGRPIKCGF